MQRPAESKRSVIVHLLVALLFIVMTSALGPPDAAALMRPCWHLDPTIVGTRRGEVLRGTDGPDVIEGLGGSDVIYGLGGDDHICGGLRADRVVGGEGDDHIQGDLGADIIVGGPGDDTLKGNEHADTIRGEDGDDHLVDGPGIPDRLRGGTGFDYLESVDEIDGDLLNGGAETDSCEGGQGDVFVNCP